MRAVIQRVKKASVKIDNEIINEIGKGLLVLLAIHKDDKKENLIKMADKIVNLRIFEDKNQKMNLSVLNSGGEILVVSQFTLYGDCKKGNRPNFMNSASPEKAENYYNKFIDLLKTKNLPVKTGKFGAMMEVSLINNGPVTIILDF